MFSRFLPAPVAIEFDSELCFLTNFMLYLGHSFYALAKNTDSDLFFNVPFPTAHPLPIIKPVLGQDLLSITSFT